ncbi:superoxide dismutase [Chroococcidiopsis sp. TS-821]|uniref:superoxide dismutase n=1 Tax=Chroococcidiopsis sp. TS-821 TaxID=1378066 RepID=UPI000CEE3B58|nr:superoxide dismutase [Chroococcidiopsis sp. TS-821]PPS43319.1 superoxide dismutase [Chroococcidiopsis sp. TS-821]
MTLNRRNLLFLLGASAGAVAIDTLRPHGLWQTALAAETPSRSGSFELPPLPYAYNALEPHIDAATMRFHHDRHHATYVKNLNAAIEKHPQLKGRSAEQLLSNLNSVPEDIRTSVRNNGGGHVNHSMFWRIMSPDGGGEPTGQIADVINQNFGSFAEFKKQFNAAGEGRFGSGWVWLVRTQDGNYQITSTANQDSPIMEGNYPVMGNDVWEHAYYLKYQNRRAEYLNAWWNVVNWNEINQRLAQATKTA